MSCAKFIISLIVATVMCFPAFGQWTEPVPISNGFGIYVAESAAAGETLHVVGNGTFEIYYQKSLDNGLTWSEPTIPAGQLYRSWMPDIITSNGLVHIVFIGRNESHQSLKAYHISSADGGNLWSEPHQVFNQSDLAFFKYPKLAANGDTLFLSCVRYPYLLTFRSFDNGETWQDSTVVENGGIVIDHSPIIMYSEGRLHLIYQLNLADDSLGIEIFHRYSDDLGLSWTDRRVLSTPEPLPNVEHGQAPSAFADDQGHLIAIWFDYKYGSFCGYTGDILGRFSADNGETWLPESRLTYSQSGSISSCIILAGKIYAIWCDYMIYGCGCPKIMYAESENMGSTWSVPELITGISETAELFPNLIYNISNAGLYFHCFITKDYENGGSDLNYLQHQPITFITEDSTQQIPNDFAISAFPNPFNSMNIISYSNLKGGDIAIYDITGRLVRTLNAGGIKEGKVTWDATDNSGKRVCSGIYFVRANTSAGVKAAKLIYLK